MKMHPKFGMEAAWKTSLQVQLGNAKQAKTEIMDLQKFTALRH